MATSTNEVCHVSSLVYGFDTGNVSNRVFFDVKMCKKLIIMAWFCVYNKKSVDQSTNSISIPSARAGKKHFMRHALYVLYNLFTILYLCISSVVHRELYTKGGVSREA